MRGNYSVASTKFWTLVANWVGLVISVIGIIGLFYSIFESEKVSLTGIAQADKALYSLMMFSSGLSLASCAYIIYFTKKVMILPLLTTVTSWYCFHYQLEEFSHQLF
ncbi:hypothetical protein SCLARK_00510 [Spiroplasma clarkii]|uniref:hypothetical protein n=1 Tax=Spiroplasma clarkii TaxID=2139 RepID=UPI000B576164|nr:hypothetical protein [Spiroplasma clarkii]ARU91204.1 hypothetical protein SCLARK_00510 [Spiroplasma clarkii]